ncbi:MAG: hypothetical protein HYX74_07485, partial [Acidobacteria bacterium]|nr:hypothetical protein [Acidobacteriota bacterium]
TAYIDSKIDGLSGRMDSKIDGLTARMDSKTDGLTARMDSQFHWLLGTILTAWVTLILTIFFRT